MSGYIWGKEVGARVEFHWLSIQEDKMGGNASPRLSTMPLNCYNNYSWSFITFFNHVCVCWKRQDNNFYICHQQQCITTFKCQASSKLKPGLAATLSLWVDGQRSWPWLWIKHLNSTASTDTDFFLNVTMTCCQWPLTSTSTKETPGWFCCNFANFELDSRCWPRWSKLGIAISTFLHRRLFAFECIEIGIFHSF